MMMMSGLGFAQGEPEFNVTGKPVWYEIVGSGTTTGTVCPVRAVANRQLLGNLEPGSRFVAFGVSSRWITLSFGGALAYVPVTAAQPVFQMSRPEGSLGDNEMRLGLPSETLEEKQKAVRERAEASKSGSKPLAPNFTNQPTPKPTPGPAVMGGGRGGVGAGRSGGEGMM